MRIQHLNSDSINRLCSSQVIPGMVACVRELTENALDANATSVSVRIRNRGGEIEVADNGGGISEGDWSSVCLPHSTSKITSLEDVSRVGFNTHGFRGEALSALCSLASGVKIVTRTPDQETGTVLSFDKLGNLLGSTEKVSKSIGTTVTVYGLFENSLPVRYLEMLSNEKKEVKILHHTLIEFAILHPSKKFELLVDGKCILNSNGAEDSNEVFKRLVTGTDLVPFACKGQDVEISGWITPPLPTPMLFKSPSKNLRVGGSESGQFMFINKRPAACNKKLLKAIVAVYSKFNIARVSFILKLSLNTPGSYDWNVSVDKRTVFLVAEVEDRIVQAVVDRLEQMFAGKENKGKSPQLTKIELRSSNISTASKRELPADVPESTTEWSPPPPRMIKRVFVNQGTPELGSAPESLVEINPVEVVVDQEPVKLHEIPLEVSTPMNFSKSLFRAMEVIGQFNNGFIITRLQGHGTELFLVDQHAANEKFLFESYFDNIKVDFQILISPITLKLSPSVEMTLTEFTAELGENGFRIEFDNTKIAGQRARVLSLPTLSGIGFNRSSALTISDLMEIIEKLSDDTVEPLHVGSCRMLKQLSSVRAMFASKACRSAVMVGDSLTCLKMTEVVNQLSDLDQPWNCPHGRPTFRHLLSSEDLRKLN